MLDYVLEWLAANAVEEVKPLSSQIPSWGALLRVLILPAHAGVHLLLLQCGDDTESYQRDEMGQLRELQSEDDHFHQLLQRRRGSPLDRPAGCDQK